MTVRSGREFLAIPGPTTVPDEVLSAMHRPAVDLYSGEIIQVTMDCISDLKKIIRTGSERLSVRCKRPWRLGGCARQLPEPRRPGAGPARAGCSAGRGPRWPRSSASRWSCLPPPRAVRSIPTALGDRLRADPGRPDQGGPRGPDRHRGRDRQRHSGHPAGPSPRRGIRRSSWSTRSRRSPVCPSKWTPGTSTVTVAGSQKGPDDAARASRSSPPGSGPAPPTRLRRPRDPLLGTGPSGRETSTT